MSDSILLIDDDIALLRALGEFFEHRGWDVHRELTGEAGLTTFARTLPDVVLVDLHLPGSQNRPSAAHAPRRWLSFCEEPRRDRRGRPM